MGPKEENGILIGRRFDGSLRKLINLKEKDRKRHYYTPPITVTSDISAHVYIITLADQSGPTEGYPL